MRYSIKRVAFYVFWEKDGIVRDFIFYYLRELLKVVDNIVFIVNGNILTSYEEELSKMGIQVFKRPNKGLDFTAWKEAIFNFGWDKIYEYDELILCNCTCYGPIYPFNEMFDEMDKSVCDFWGAAKHPEQKNYLLPNKKGYIYEHIMSYFLVFRRTLTHSDAFKSYWDNLPSINNKTDAVGLCETQLTKHFEDLGFKSDAFVDLKKYEGRANNGSIFYSNEFLINDRCPLVKRRAFFFPLYDNILDFSDGHQAKELMEFITKYTNYDENLIWDDILATQPMSTIMNNMHLNCIIDGSRSTSKELQNNTLFIFSIRHQFQIEYLKKYIEKSGITFAYIISFNKEYKSLIKDAFSTIETFNFKLIDSDLEKSIFEQIKITSKNVSNYTTFCTIDLRDMPHPLTISYEDCYKYMCETLIGNENQVKNIASKFETNKRLGMLIPYPVSFANYETYASCLLRYNKNVWPEFYKSLNLTVPYDEKLNILYENCFWGRIELLKNFAKITPQIREIFPSFYPLQAQQEGFYCSYMSSTYGAEIALNNALYRKHQIENIVFAKQKNNVCQGRALINKIAKNVDIKDQISDSCLHFKDVKKVVKEYFRQKKQRKNKKRCKEKLINYGNIWCRYIGIDQGRIILHLLSSESNVYLQCGVYKYYPKQELSLTVCQLQDYYKNYNGNGIFIEIPLEKVKNNPILIKRSEEGYYTLKWGGTTFSYGCFDLKQEGVYTRIYKGHLYIEDKFHFYKNVLFSKKYSIGEKLLFMLTKINPVHKYILFAENGGAGDNCFELFKYAVQKNKNCYFLASKSVIAGIQDTYLKKHMVVFNSWKHILIFLCSYKWITSYSLLLELLPQKKFLKDFLMYNISGEWIFVPHGITCDKISIMVHKYSWGNPKATYCCCNLEKNYFSEKYEFRNVSALGDPRMDKWFNAKLDDNKILLFFTWRFEMRTAKDKTALEKNYISNIISIVQMIQKNFSEKHIYYVFHHEVVRAGLDDRIRKELGDKNISYIYFNSTQGIQEFNTQFKSSKYLITDYSSVAYDFAYKKGSIPIYYLNSEFIAGHYPLEEKFFDIHLGVLTRSIEELEKALKLNAPTSEMKKRKDRFFKYQDNRNSERVYNAIFKGDKKQ